MKRTSDGEVEDVAVPDALRVLGLAGVLAPLVPLDLPEEERPVCRPRGQRHALPRDH